MNANVLNKRTNLKPSEHALKTEFGIFILV